MKTIVEVIRQYEAKHEGEAPTRWDELVKDEDTARLCVWPHSPKLKMFARGEIRMRDLELDPDYILPKVRSNQVYVYERPGLWPDQKIMVALRGQSPPFKRMTVSDLKALLQKGGAA